MKSIAAIDLINGQVVRLINGKLENKIIYSNDPIEIAKRWEADGVDSIHLVDLDLALNTGKNNTELILKIVDTVRIPIQIAGGIRSINTVNKLLEMNKLLKVVIGTMAFKNPEIIKKITKKRLCRIILAVDHNKENIMISGWKEFSGMKLFDAIEVYQNIGINNFLLTNIDKDGTLDGADVETIVRINKKFKHIKIISSGGISNILDIIKLRNAKCHAVILGKALYDNKLSINQVQKVI